MALLLLEGRKVMHLKPPPGSAVRRLALSFLVIIPRQGDHSEFRIRQRTHGCGGMQKHLSIISRFLTAIGKRRKLSSSVLEEGASEYGPHGALDSQSDDEDDEDDDDDDSEQTEFRRLRQVIRLTPWLHDVCHPSLLCRLPVGSNLVITIVSFVLALRGC